ncbi:zf-HC2 domain-containing protein [Occallatibacter savannae]|uniref:zf-HC2 domain-containing protein n=1 Tax=Occallatibacter savannae TaxID=1002691 RepID=UPI000D68A65D|nr:zf-HC2 domain-containing protein [Occallatibacter savannae]
MNPMIQPGTHPDAETLNAFAEQLVNEREREEILAHMADCGRCREIVFLARQAMDEEPVRPIAPVPTRKVAGGWFRGFRLAWIPVAALAGIVGVAVIRHADHASHSETRMAQNAPPPEPMRSADKTKAVSAPQTPQSQALATSERKAAESRRLGQDAERDRKVLDEEQAVAPQKKDEPAKDSDSVTGFSEKAKSAEAYHGTFAARANSPALGGPLLQNQVQQNNAPLQQNSSNAVRQASGLSDSANNPTDSVMKKRSASQAMTVEAGTAAPTPASPAPSAAPAMAAAQMQTEAIPLAGKDQSMLKAANPALPSKQALLSQATVGTRAVAVDTSGSVFVSEDAGRHWEAVSAQWDGRAVRVKSQQGASAEGGSLKQQAPSKFELTTDKPEIWISDDGKRWTREPPAPNQ